MPNPKKANNGQGGLPGSVTPATPFTPASSGTSSLLGLSAKGLLSEVQAALSSKLSLYSYQGVVSVLSALGKALGSSGLTTTQFSDLKTYASAVGKTEGLGSYLYGVLNAFVNGNSANATWTGGKSKSVALGNLATGTNSTKFQELLGKWFLGTDLPTWSTSATFTISQAPLFKSAGVSMSDPTQGGIGDCYFISALVETAEDQPDLIKSMITDNGNGTYGVRFYNNGTPVYVTVNNANPTNGFVAGTVSGASWVTILEKAFVEYKNEVYGAANAYSSINGGWDEGLTALTGKTVTSYLARYTSSLAAWETSVKNTVISALAAGEEVLFGSFIDDKDAGNGKIDMVSDHEFAVTGYDKTSGKFVLQNPWGAAGGSSWNGVFEQSIDQLWGGQTGDKSYSGFLVASGNSPIGAVATALASSASVLTNTIASIHSAVSASVSLESHAAMHPIQLATPV